MLLFISSISLKTFHLLHLVVLCCEYSFRSCVTSTSELPHDTPPGKHSHHGHTLSLCSAQATQLMYQPVQES